MSHLSSYPPDLPVPKDDGACDHLLGHEIAADIKLRVTHPEPIDASNDDGQSAVSVAELSDSGIVVIFFYPRTGSPEENVPKEWDAIPGARGCTPQNCSFRDAHTSLLSSAPSSLPLHLFGCSTQPTSVHASLTNRFHLTFPLLSDQDLGLCTALRLPTFEWKGQVLIKRLTIAVIRRRIVKVWYPIFPPDSNPPQVEEWLKHEAGGIGAKD